jgi:riboflavin synthase
MFTGIIETIAVVLEIRSSQTNIHFHISCPFISEISIDQSISHNGICLTVTEKSDEGYWVTAIAETLHRTNLGQLKVGDPVNIERCLPVTGRFDGHYVQGHVDCIGIIDEIHDVDGSYLIFIQHDKETGITVNKGSVAVNGISLTVVDSFPDAFSVAIIPYTWEHTNLKHLEEGDQVNIEFDIFGKYVQKYQSMNL